MQVPIAYRRRVKKDMAWEDMLKATHSVDRRSDTYPVCGSLHIGSVMGKAGCDYRSPYSGSSDPALGVHPPNEQIHHGLRLLGDSVIRYKRIARLKAIDTYIPLSIADLLQKSGGKAWIP